MSVPAVDPTGRPASGQEVAGAHRERLWNLAKEFIPCYAGYERLAGRQTIPLLMFTETE